MNAIHKNHLYPPIAMEAEISGDVSVRFIVDANGLPREFVIVTEDPPGFDFGEKAIEALKAMRYKPGYRDGQYLEQPLLQRVRFVP